MSIKDNSSFYIDLCKRKRGFNFPLDYCDDCGWNGSTVHRCPLCDSENVTRLRRVSGYLSKESSFTDGKRAELAHRHTHFR